MILRCVPKRNLLNVEQLKRPRKQEHLNVRSRTTNGEGIIQDTFPISI